AVAEALLVVPARLAEAPTLGVGEVEPGAAHRHEPLHDATVDAERRERRRIECDAGCELRAGGMPGEDDRIAVPTVARDVRMDPPHRSRHIRDLLGPRHLWLQAIADDGDPNAVAGIEPSDVAVDVGPTDEKALVTARPATAMDEDEHRPAGAAREEE